MPLPQNVVRYVFRDKHGGQSYSRVFATTMLAAAEMTKLKTYHNPKLERVYLQDADGIMSDMWIRSS